MKESRDRQLSGVVQTLESTVERLLEDHRQLSEHCKALRRECEELKRAEREAQERAQKLQRELERADLITTMSGGGGLGQGGNRRARAYINRLMREVDNCIALLSATGIEQQDEQRGEDGNGGDNN